MTVAKTRAMIAVLVLAGAAAAVGLWTARHAAWPLAGSRAHSATGELRPVEIVLHPFSRKVVRQCHIDYGAPRSVEAMADGRLLALKTQGAAVKKDEPIARFDSAKLEGEERSVVLELRNLRERLAFRAGAYREQTDAIAAIERQDLKGRRDRIKESLDEIAALAARGQIAPNRVEEVRLKHDEARTALSRFEHQQALQRAQDALDLGQLRYTVEKTENRLADIRAELERAVIRAPSDGRIVWTDPAFAAKGEGPARAGMAIGSIVDPTRFGARLRFIDSDMSVVEGSAAAVSFGSGKAPVEAEILSTRLIDDPLEQKRGRFEYAVEIAFPAANHEDALHAQAVCSFTKALDAPAPAIPASAIVFENGRRYARSLRNGRVGLVAVELGEVSGNVVRILSGLQPGDVVLEP